MEETAMAAIEQLEERLRASEQRLKILFEFSSDWYWEQDANYRFTLLTRKTSAEERFHATESIGKTRWELPYVKITEAQWQAHRAVLDARQPFHDFVLRRRDTAGNLRITSISGAPVFDADGKFSGYCGIGQDITDRRLAQQREAMEHAVARVLAHADAMATAIPEILQTNCTIQKREYG